MRVRYTDEMSEALSDATKKELGIDTRWHSRSGDFMATGMTKERTEALIAEVEALGNPKGYRVFIGALKKHLQVIAGKTPKASGAAQMETLLKRYIALEVPNQTLYTYANDRYYGFHVGEVRYIPESTDRDGRKVPAEVVMSGHYVHMGKKADWSKRWSNGSCYTTPAALLAESGYHIETKELKAEQDRYLELFLERLKVGDQFLTSGKGHHNRSGWSSRDRENDAGYNANHFDLGASGESIVVVDVIDDADGRSNDRDLSEMHYENDYYWRNLRERFKKETEGGAKLEEDDEWEADASENDNHTRLPVHHLIPVFDLGRHDTFTVHAADLTPYPWDTSIFDKLVIPDSHKHLIHTLSASGEKTFADLVKGKSGGTNILLTGRPGTGKTLSAEIFAESTMRPLYRVHCAQLGTKPDDMERELLDVFRRAARWDAIILLDEADVYIRERGTDLQANAVVGVFLRVLEYQTTVLFMTTNLPDSVDDAIASRCVVRIDYEYPEPDDLREIWRVLADGAGMEISEETIEKAVKFFPMTGRDVKNTLKLIQTAGAEVTFKTINAASSFHPNRGNWDLADDLPKPDTSTLLRAPEAPEVTKAKRFRTRTKKNDATEA